MSEQTSDAPGGSTAPAADTLDAAAGNDTITGGAGNDTVAGGGPDTMDGSAGGDSLGGGAGADTVAGTSEFVGGGAGGSGAVGVDIIVGAGGGAGGAASDLAIETLVIPPDDVIEHVEPTVELTAADAQALKDHVEIRVAELVAFCRQEAAKYGAEPEDLARHIVHALHDALHPED